MAKTIQFGIALAITAALTMYIWTIDQSTALYVGIGGFIGAALGYARYNFF